MNTLSKQGLHLACLAALALVLGACAPAADEQSASPAPGTEPAPAPATQTSMRVRLGYVEWDSCVAATNVAAVALERAGYEVETMSVTGAMMYQGLAAGDLDAIVCAWLPTTHADYYAKTRSTLDDLGTNMSGARLGLAVPAWMEIDSIPDLADPDVAGSIDDRIIGIDPGAGLMRLTQDVIDHYALPETLVEGSDATMTGVLKDAIRQHQPVVVTSWTPHWMWAAWDLKYLDDPDNVYGEPDDIHTLVRTGLAQEMPQAYAVLHAFRMDGDARSAVMAADREARADPMANARAWVDEHADEVADWLPGA